MITRRSFLKKSSAAAGIVGLGSLYGCTPRSEELRGSLTGPDMSVGHKVRELLNIKPVEISKEDVVIVGGGASGLSAARWLNRNNISFRLLELETETGGNSRSGSNKLGRYPLGAHYLPLPSLRHKNLQQFLEECDVITGYRNGLPVFNEYHLCFDPKERLLVGHHWQNGLIPSDGISDAERDDIRRFHDLMHRYRELVGSDGKFAFDIPVDESSQDNSLLQLDKITMSRFLSDHKLTTAPLRWYVNYCCCDDFGSTVDETSAWAGIHYFASRKGKAANADLDDVLTWPEGNGFLIDHLVKGIGNKINARSVVLAVTPNGNTVDVDYFDVATGTVKRIESKGVIVAVPAFVAKHLVRASRDVDFGAFQYAPWMVANIVVDSWLGERRGEPLSWDNVIYGSSSLGYVLSQHQNVELGSGGKTITYYRALTGADCAQTRKVAMETKWESWRDSIFADLKVAHPGIRQYSKQLDVWIWGHGMIRPSPGFIWSENRMSAQKPVGDRIHFAHSDISGISVFEEAFESGTKAASALMKII